MISVARSNWAVGYVLKRVWTPSSSGRAGLFQMVVALRACRAILSFCFSNCSRSSCHAGGSAAVGIGIGGFENRADVARQRDRRPPAPLLERTQQDVRRIDAGALAQSLAKFLLARVTQ